MFLEQAAAFGVTVPHNLPSIVNGLCRARPSPEPAEVPHPASAIPEEGMFHAAACPRLANNLAMIVDSVCTAGVSPERSEVGHSVAERLAAAGGSSSRRHLWFAR